MATDDDDDEVTDADLIAFFGIVGVLALLIGLMWLLGAWALIIVGLISFAIACAVVHQSRTSE